MKCRSFEPHIPEPNQRPVDGSEEFLTYPVVLLLPVVGIVLIEQLLEIIDQCALRTVLLEEQPFPGGTIGDGLQLEEVANAGCFTEDPRPEDPGGGIVADDVSQ